MQISDTPDEAWFALPPLVFNDTRWQASPDARVLATHQVRGIPLDDPMLIIRNQNQHRTAALLGAGTWRWKNLPDDLQTVAPFWADMFANTILSGRMVHLFGSGHSRIMVEEMWPRYGSFPGFHPIVELSLTYHHDVVGANGQRQAMFLENV